jgi:hypothetical protein
VVVDTQMLVETLLTLLQSQLYAVMIETTPTLRRLTPR